MNKVFKVIWSEARNAYVVVSEMAKSHGTKSCSTKKLLAMLIATGVMTCASVAPVMAEDAVNLAPDATKIAIGEGAVASGKGSVVAIGQKASASGEGSVALGVGSVADRANAVSVGSTGANRQIINVAAGTEGTDAVNVSQLQKVSDTANKGWNLATNGFGPEATNVKPGDYVDFSGDKNISVSHDGTKVQVELNKNIDVNSIKTNALNSKYNLSVGTMAENGIMPFLVNSTGAFYAANNNFSVDKDGKVIATAGEIGNVVLKNGVYTGNSALRDGELYVGDASGNYSQITTTGAKLGQVTIAADGKISGVAAGEVSKTSTALSTAAN